MAGDEFQKQLDLVPVLDDAKYGRVYLIQESQEMHAQEAVKLNGHFALSDGLNVENHLKLTQSFHLKLTHPVTA